MTMQFLRFRVVIPKLRCCLALNSDRYTKISMISHYRIPIRSYMNRISDKYETKLRTRDLVPEGYKLIYRGGMDTYIHIASKSSTILMLLGFMNILAVVFNTENAISFPMSVGLGSIIGIKSYTQFFIMYAVFVIMLWSVRQISVRYVLRMYYNPTTKTYRAMRIGFLPMVVSHHDFQARTLNRVSKKHMLPWNNVRYKTNGQTLLIFEHGFKTSADYDRMFLHGSMDIENENEDQDIPKYRN